MTVQLSTSLPSFSAEDPGGWEHLSEAARRLDAAGFDRAVLSDHVVFGEDLDSYGRPELGGRAGGRQPTGPDGHWLEPLTTLAFLAGQTRRIRFGTNILLAALRRPVVLAKSAATLDVLSQGRLDLGVGVGWQRAEYDAAGLDFDDRGRLLDETLAVCRTLWREPVATLSVDGREVGPIHQQPKPPQVGGVPIWVSGTINARMVRRLARFGSGWIPWGDDAGDLATSIPRLRTELERLGRDPEGLQVVGNLRVARSDDGSVDVAATVAGAGPLVEAGATDLRVGLRPDDLDPDGLAALVAAFRAATGRD